jgi:hypothetical protein
MLAVNFTALFKAIRNRGKKISCGFGIALKLNRSSVLPHRDAVSAKYNNDRSSLVCERLPFSCTTARQALQHIYSIEKQSVEDELANETLGSNTTAQ